MPLQWLGIAYDVMGRNSTYKLHFIVVHTVCEILLRLHCVYDTGSLDFLQLTVASQATGP